MVPQIIHLNRVFHYKPSILGAHPYFWKHPFISFLLPTGVHRHQSSSYWDGSESKWFACTRLYQSNCTKGLEFELRFLFGKGTDETYAAVLKAVEELGTPVDLVRRWVFSINKNLEMENCSGCQVHEQTWRNWYDNWGLEEYSRIHRAQKISLQVLLHWPANFDKKVPSTIEGVDFDRLHKSWLFDVYLQCRGTSPPMRSYLLAKLSSSSLAWSRTCTERREGGSSLQTSHCQKQPPKAFDLLILCWFLVLMFLFIQLWLSFCLWISTQHYLLLFLPFLWLLSNLVFSYIFSFASIAIYQ